VLDGAGRVVPHARVWITDPTLVGADLTTSLNAEAWRAAAGRAGWWWVESDARGAFRIPGVFAREYRVQAVDPRTLATGAAIVVPGAPVELSLSDQVSSNSLVGCVRDERGAPVANVRVALARNLWRSDGGSEPVEQGLELAPTLTDAAGCFVLPPSALVGTRIDLCADGILPAAAALRDLDPAKGLEFSVSRRAYLRVELDGAPERADAIALIDAGGETSNLVLLREWCPYLYPRAPLVDGRSLVFAASLEARMVIFYRGEEEVGRAPLALRAGELSVLRW
jgi:hypothetical protein